MDTCNSGIIPKPLPGRELFLAPLEVFLSPMDFERVRFAYACSKYGHSRQIRDDGGRYFDHPKGAAWIYISEFNGRDPRIIIDLLLHDIPEDSYLLTGYRMGLNFGEDCALDVQAVTKLPKGKESTCDYIKRVVYRGPWAILTKLIDRLHNLRTLGVCSKEKIEKQLAETKEYHCKVLIPALHECGDDWLGYASSIEMKISEAVAAIEENSF